MGKIRQLRNIKMSKSPRENENRMAYSGNPVATLNQAHRGRNAYGTIPTTVTVKIKDMRIQEFQTE